MKEDSEEILKRQVYAAVKNNPSFFSEIINSAMAGIIQAEKDATSYGVDMEVIAFNCLRNGKFKDKPSLDFVKERYQKHSKELRFTKEGWDEVANDKLKPTEGE